MGRKAQHTFLKKKSMFKQRKNDFNKEKMI